MPGYGLPTGTRGLLPWTWAEDRLRRSHNYLIVTVRGDGRPHVMPVWGIWADGAFFFSTGRESRKAQNLSGNPSCIVCTEKLAEEVIVEGIAVEVTDAARLKELAPAYHRKYKPWKLEPDLGPVFAVEPRVVFGLREKTFKAATRWLFGSTRAPAIK
jgi:nitroimidazol reductase NimA-like FMN-containing flavoprotein (pyridoxamine 5'-phosphate oxidase superfamily)